ncbi:hypothetical protein L873DRAFT_1459982 [Choiromyces venosus 120613-1]|uniref:Uncharacterized protein n=1 Tax=Choiromyces venosus 120613-1 TaxID=1336337 RepID=A0A3N4K0V6_9PEZI|nr:hypothetical protein L873DRAFT_1459982 [Choiromyces venosus 120613-1]
MPFQQELDRAELAVNIINHKLFAWRPNDRKFVDPYVQTARQAIQNIKFARAEYDAMHQDFGSAEGQIENSLVILKGMSDELDKILLEAKIIPGPVPKGRPEAVSCFSDFGDDSSVEGGGGGKGMKGIKKGGKKIFQKVKKKLSFRGEGAGGGGEEEDEKVVHRVTLQKDFDDPNRYSQVDWTERPGYRSSRSRRQSSSSGRVDGGRPSSRGQHGAVQESEVERKARKEKKKEVKGTQKRRHTLESSNPPGLNATGDYANYLRGKYNESKSAASSSSALPNLLPLDGRPQKASAVTHYSPEFSPPSDTTYRRRGGSLGGYHHRPLLDPNIRSTSHSSPTPPPLSLDTSASDSSTKLSMISARTEALFEKHLQQSAFRSGTSPLFSPPSSRPTPSREGEHIVRPSVGQKPQISKEYPRDSSHGLVYTPTPTVAPLVIRKKKKNSAQLAPISEEPVEGGNYTHFSYDHDTDDYSDSVVTDEFSFSDEVFDRHAAGVLEALDRMAGPGIHFDRVRGYDGSE